MFCIGYEVIFNIGYEIIFTGTIIIDTMIYSFNGVTIITTTIFSNSNDNNDDTHIIIIIIIMTIIYARAPFQQSGSAGFPT